MDVRFIPLLLGQIAMTWVADDMEVAAQADVRRQNTSKIKVMRLRMAFFMLQHSATYSRLFSTLPIYSRLLDAT